jgi:MFS family permease
LSNYITSSINPILVNIATDFDVSLTKASWLITFNLLFLGIGNLFWIPLCHKIGKRPVLLLCTGIFCVSSIWSAVAKDWGSLFGARIIQGFGASASEALGPAIVADLYFLHERGLWVGVYTLMIAVGSALGAVFAGLIARATTDWHWVFWMNVILTGACFLAVLLFQAETNFNRPVEFETGEGLEQSELAIIRARANSAWVQSLSVTSWYDRYVSSFVDCLVQRGC